jgi:hypothetical protein
MQGIYYQSSILEMLYRAEESNTTNCECSTFERYLIGTSVFDCTEAMKFNTNDVYDYYSSHNLDSMTLDSIGSDSLIYFSQQNPNQEISMKQINDIIVAASLYDLHGVDNLTGTTVFSPPGFLWGSDIGCCGNYNFYCLFSSVTCFLQNFACYCCSEWHCGSCSSECD